MEKKYEFTNETTVVDGRTLHRIRALRSFGNVKAGDLGGWIEKEENLSHSGNAWVYDDAWVASDAFVADNARVAGDACVAGDAWVCCDAFVADHAFVTGNAFVTNNARVTGNARVADTAWVTGDAWVTDNAFVTDDARVAGNAFVVGDACVTGDALVTTNSDYFCINGAGSKNGNTTFFRCRTGEICVNCDWFNGTLAEFTAKVHEMYGGTMYEREYNAAIELVKIHFDVEDEV